MALKKFKPTSPGRRFMSVSAFDDITKVPAKPKRRGAFKGTRPGWKKAVVKLRAGESIEIFQGATV